MYGSDNLNKITYLALNLKIPKNVLLDDSHIIIGNYITKISILYYNI